MAANTVGGSAYVVDAEYLRMNFLDEYEPFVKAWRKLLERTNGYAACELLNDELSIGECFDDDSDEESRTIAHEACTRWLALTCLVRLVVKLELVAGFHDQQARGERGDDVDGIYYEAANYLVPNPEISAGARAAVSLARFVDNG